MYTTVLIGHATPTQELERLTRLNPVYLRVMNLCLKMIEANHQVTAVALAFRLNYSPSHVTSVLRTLQRIGCLRARSRGGPRDRLAKIWELAIAVPKPEPIRVEARTIYGQEVEVKVYPAKHASGSLVWPQALSKWQR